MKRTLKVLNEMEEAGIISRYAIGGAVGAIFYMEAVLTYDLDVFVQLPSSSGGLLTLSPIYDYLKDRGYKEEKECIVIEGVPVQFLPVFNPLTEEALKQSKKVDYEGVTTRVLRAEHLVAIMLQTNRPKDRQRLVSFMSEAIIDQTYLMTVLTKFDLQKRWQEWTTP